MPQRHSLAFIFGQFLPVSLDPTSTWRSAVGNYMWLALPSFDGKHIQVAPGFSISLEINQGLNLISSLPCGKRHVVRPNRFEI